MGGEASAVVAVAAAVLGTAAALAPAGAAAAECSAAATSVAVGGAAVAEGAGGWGAREPWRVEGTAEAGVGGGYLGRRSSRAPACAHLRGAQTECGWEGWEAHAGLLRDLSHRWLMGDCNCAAGGNAEPHLRQLVMASRLVTTVCGSASQLREWFPPVGIDLPQTHAAYPSWPAKRCSQKCRRGLMQL